MVLIEIIHHDDGQAVIQIAGDVDEESLVAAGSATFPLLKMRSEYILQYILQIQI
jgi:hypothetical protein